MKALLIVICVVALLEESVAPPPRRSDKKEEVRENSETVGIEEFGIEYERYLREVIDVLESDPDFKRKLEQAEETDIRTGKIAHELSYVDHNVRSKLDEVKRAELERLRHLAQKQYELSNGIDVDHMKIMPPEHLDHGNPHTFEIEDLKKLIHKVTYDLNEADKKRREEFKEYEMQKEFENNEKLKHLEGVEKENFEKQLKENDTKHKQHEPLHHPGSKQQLEEVWEKQDKMQQEFNPKVFFQLHDVDGNGFWDQTEVKALFLKELDKMYQAGAPEDDMRERAEELERMREHVFRETDRNGDQLISYEEFLEQTKKPEFEKDPSWETIDQQPVYTHEEYAEFERRRMEEIQKLINQGLIPPQPVYHVPPGYHHPGMQQQYPGQQQQQFHPNQQYHNPQQPQHNQQFQQIPNHGQQFQNQQYQQHPNQQHPQAHLPPTQQQQPNQGVPHPNLQPHPGQQVYQQGHPQPHGQQVYQQGHPQPHGQQGYQQPSVHQGQQLPVHQGQQPPVPQGHQQPPGQHGYQPPPAPQGHQQPQGQHGYEPPPAPQGHQLPPAQHGYQPPVAQGQQQPPVQQNFQQQQPSGQHFNPNEHKQPQSGDSNHGQAPPSQQPNIQPAVDTHPNSIGGGSQKASDQGKSG